MKIEIELDDDIIDPANGFASADELERAVNTAIDALGTDEGDTIYLGARTVRVVTTEAICIRR